MGGCDHRVRYPLARIVTVLVRWDPLANIRQRGGHIGHHVLIELDQHRFGPTKLAFKAFDLAMQSDVLCSIENHTALAFSNRHERTMRERSNGPLKATISF